MTYIIGMDLSLNTPAMVTLERNGRLSKVVAVHFATEVKKVADEWGAWRFTPSDKDVSKKSELYRMERVNYLYKAIVGEVKTTNPTHVALEGYAISNRGADLFTIELVSLVKMRLFNLYFPYRIYTPGELKLMATDYGNSDKRRMLEACEQQWGEELNNVIELDAIGKLKQDVLEACACAKLLHYELCVREDPTCASEMPEPVRKIFNRVTKNRDGENLLVQDFVRKQK